MILGVGILWSWYIGELVYRGVGILGHVVFLPSQQAIPIVIVTLYIKRQLSCSTEK